jgi:hypothetical protein
MKVVSLRHQLPPPLPPEIFLVLISVRDWIDPRNIVKPVALGDRSHKPHRESNWVLHIYWNNFCNTFIILFFSTYSVVFPPIFLVLVSSYVCTHFRAYKKRSFVSSNDIRFRWAGSENETETQNTVWSDLMRNIFFFLKRKPCSQVGYRSSVNILLCLGITNKCINSYQFILLCCSYIFRQLWATLREQSEIINW